MKLMCGPGREVLDIKGFLCNPWDGQSQAFAEWSVWKKSPVLQVYDYRKNQLERDILENAIRHVDIDLATETIKKGLPYTLRIVKTPAAYQRQLKQWNEDAALLKKVMHKIETFAC